MITLYGFYQYRPDLMDGVMLSGTMEEKILIDLIMERSGMLFPYHQQPDYLKSNIANWFNRKSENFQRMYDALTAEYNPIENYDRNEEWTDTPDITRERSGGHTLVSEGKAEMDGINEVSAYNASNYQPDGHGKDVTEGKTTDTFTYQSEAEKESGTSTHKGRTHGNIGVTTNQQMIQSELELRMYDLYEVIAEMFENNFLIQVY